MALVGTTFFVLRLLLALFFGGHGDLDTSGDVDFSTDASFSFFSLLSILAFFMGAGWMGLSCRIDWQMSSFGAAATSALRSQNLTLKASPVKPNRRAGKQSRSTNRAP